MPDLLRNQPLVKAALADIAKVDPEVQLRELLGEGPQGPVVKIEYFDHPAVLKFQLNRHRFGEFKDDHLLVNNAVARGVATPKWLLSDRLFNPQALFYIQDFVAGDSLEISVSDLQLVFDMVEKQADIAPSICERRMVHCGPNINRLAAGARSNSLGLLADDSAAIGDELRSTLAGLPLARSSELMACHDLVWGNLSAQSILIRDGHAVHVDVDSMSVGPRAFDLATLYSSMVFDGVRRDLMRWFAERAIAVHGEKIFATCVVAATFEHLGRVKSSSGTVRPADAQFALRAISGVADAKGLDL